jgi:beta-barrel assembly-enhancing protease
MSKIITNTLVLFALFFVTWFALNQINWMQLFQVEKISEKTEQELGKIYSKIFTESDSNIEDEYLKKTIDTIVQRITDQNYIDSSKIKIHLVENPEINAFALPDYHIVIYTGLLNEVQNEEELAGIICHEIAHLELNHVTKKLIKEIGINAILSMTTGQKNGQLIKESIGVLSSTAYDRILETQADSMAVTYLTHSNISPKPLADFLIRLSNNKPDSEITEWINTHPDSKDRAKNIMGFNFEIKENQRILTDSSWSLFKEKAKMYQ